MKTIKITLGSHECLAELYPTLTAEALYNRLPLEGKCTFWGKEVYFMVPLQLAQDADAREVVEVGELGFWPVGSAFCIFYGPTPVSTDQRPRAYSAVNVFGRIIQNLEVLPQILPGEAIRVEAL